MTMHRFAAIALFAASISSAQAPAAPAEAVNKPDLAGEPTAPAASLPSKPWFERIELFGYVKAGYFAVIPPSDTDSLVGSHNGFRLTAARLGFTIKPTEHVEVVASVDGAVAKRAESDPLTGNRVVELRDGYIDWSAHRFAELRVGQFKAPYNAETLLGDGFLPFIQRSVISEGVIPPEGGSALESLSLDRQIGVQVGSARLGAADSVGFKYALGVFNGNGANVLNNDNNSVMPAARAVVEFKDLVSVGVNGYYNPLTEGNRPTRLLSNRVGFGGDVALHVAGFDLLAVYLARQVSHPGTGLANDNGSGLMVSAHYLLESMGVEGGARFSMLDLSDTDPNDSVNEIAVMVGYRARRVPVRVLLQYTLRGEAAAATIGNNSLDALAQVSW